MISSSVSAPIAVLGAGSWGTALALHLAKYHQVRVWDFNTVRVSQMRQARENAQYLPGFALPENIYISDQLSEILHGVQDVLCVLPSHAVRNLLLSTQVELKNKRLILASKGIEPHTHQLLSQVAEDVLGSIPLAVLSGPSFAKEVAKGLPTAVVIASKDREFLTSLTQQFHRDFFRVYMTHDLIGVQIGGALKNVFAIAAGASDGLGFGANARAALITRALAEMTRLGLAMGAEAKTFMGLSGVGDLILTCTDNQSRNRRFGLAIAQGKSLAEAKHEINQVIEGQTTAEHAMKLAKHYQVDMPITEQIYNVLEGNITPEQAFRAFLSRDAAVEF